jgi:UTP--glucose-1-phosphate uridylyltransferase
MKVRKAVFPVAGFGSRFLPATKASPKEMLPIVDKPLIQFAVEEAAAAGITDMIFITGRNKRAIEDHFDKAYELENELALKNKDALLQSVRSVVPAGINCIYIRQPEALGLGHAVLCAQPAVGNEPFAVILADDLIDSGEPVIGQMIRHASGTPCSVLGVMDVPPADTGSYGIVETDAALPANPELLPIRRIVEKPKAGMTASTLAVVGRYLLTPDIFGILENVSQGAGGEIQLTDGIAELMNRQHVCAYRFQGRRYDCGSKLGYLEATVDYGLKHTEVGEGFQNYLKSIRA